MRTFVPCFNILPKSQMSMWHMLAPCKDLGFVLYGGTAIALQLGHRSSIDFDFFSHFPLDQTKEKELLTVLPFLKDSELIQIEQDTRSYLSVTSVKFSFFGGIRFGRIGVPQTTSDGILHVASLEDLLSLKLATILQRVEAKDYIDIAAIIRSGVSLEKGMSGAVALYGKQFLLSESLKALTYFHGGDLQRLSELDKNTLLHAAQMLPLRELPQINLISNNLFHF